MFEKVLNYLINLNNTSIDVFECDRPHIIGGKLPNNSQWNTIAQPRRSLQFSAWNFAHAVVKADFLVQKNLLLPSIGFLLQMDQIIDLTSRGNLRLVAGAAAALNDVTQTSISGRIGQGLSILFAVREGYAYVGHLSSDPVIVAHAAANGRSKVADFLFEDAANDRMILESKATLSLPQNSPSNIKYTLKKALSSQVSPWINIISPPATKGYAVYSCLRENTSATPSAIAFVDPPGDDVEGVIELPPYWTRRQNYAAWLAAMGFFDASRRLRSTEGSVPRVRRLSILRVGEDHFAINLQNWGQGLNFGVGMKVDALNAVSSTIRGSRDSLLNLRPTSSLVGTEAITEGSIFPDGTFLGLVNKNSLAGSEQFLL